MAVRVGRVLVEVVVGLLLAGALALAVAIAVLPAVTGSHVFTVLTGSMRPARPPGTVVVARPRPADEISVGEVVSFTERPQGLPPRTVTHRVVSVDPARDGAGPVFHTKGDANPSVDPGGTVAADVLGVEWYHVPYVGRVRERIVGPPGLMLLGGLILLGVARAMFTPPKQPTAQPTAADAPTEPLPVVPARHR